MIMKRAMLRTGRQCRKLAPPVALALAAIIGGASAAPALAQDYDRGRGYERGYDVERRHDNRHHHYRGSDDDSRYYSRPAYVYAPPPVYYAPPPGPPVIDFVFPLRFR
jgi:hypothetical protein